MKQSLDQYLKLRLKKLDKEIEYLEFDFKELEIKLTEIIFELDFIKKQL